MNENLTAIGYDKVESSGAFNFPSMEYGVYYLRAELAGVAADNLKLEITPEQPHVDVILSFSGNSILGTETLDFGKEAVSIYPNPVIDRLNISLSIPFSDMVVMEIYTITGQLVYRTGVSVNPGENTFSILLGDLKAGLYTLKVAFKDGSFVVKKVVVGR
jgi:hypothetical protein